MTKAVIKNQVGTVTYQVKNINCQMTNDQLIDFCDPMNWGGRVTRNGDTEAEVVVYTD